MMQYSSTLGHSGTGNYTLGAPTKLMFLDSSVVKVFRPGKSKDKISFH